MQHEGPRATGGSAPVSTKQATRNSKSVETRNKPDVSFGSRQSFEGPHSCKDAAFQDIQPDTPLSKTLSLENSSEQKEVQNPFQTSKQMILHELFEFDVRSSSIYSKNGFVLHDKPKEKLNETHEDNSGLLNLTHNTLLSREVPRLSNPFAMPVTPVYGSSDSESGVRRLSSGDQLYGSWNNIFLSGQSRPSAAASRQSYVEFQRGDEQIGISDSLFSQSILQTQFLFEQLNEKQQQDLQAP